jgi:flagellar biosynthesis protein FlhG
LLCNLAVDLAAKGKKVLLFDGDLGMANADIMFGMRAQGHILHVLEGQADVKDVINPVEKNIDLISGGSGIVDYNNLTVFQRQALVQSFSQLEKNYDYLLIDTAPGIAENVLYLNAAVQMPCVIITPEPSSLADSYALIKVLNQRYKETRFAIVCNQVRDEKEGLSLYQRFNDVAAKFLCVSLDFWGAIPHDGALRKSTHMQRLVLKHEPNCDAAEAIRSISAKLERTLEKSQVKGGLQVFWENLVGVA